MHEFKPTLLFVLTFYWSAVCLSLHFSFNDPHFFMNMSTFYYMFTFYWPQISLCLHFIDPQWCLFSFHWPIICSHLHFTDPQFVYWPTFCLSLLMTIHFLTAIMLKTFSFTHNFIKTPLHTFLLLYIYLIINNTFYWLTICLTIHFLSHNLFMTLPFIGLQFVYYSRFYWPTIKIVWLIIVYWPTICFIPYISRANYFFYDYTIYWLIMLLTST